MTIVEYLKFFGICIGIAVFIGFFWAIAESVKDFILDTVWSWINKEDD